MKTYILAILASCCIITAASPLAAQSIWFTKSGSVSFTSKTSLETIEATNSKASCVLDTKNGTIETGVLIKAFLFEKALMQEHFNENYLESDTYPKSTFKGTISNTASITYSKDGTYPIQVTGQLTMHGKTKPALTTGTLTIANGKYHLQGTFSVALADYNVEIPKVVEDKISKKVSIACSYWLEPLK